MFMSGIVKPFPNCSSMAFGLLTLHQKLAQPPRSIKPVPKTADLSQSCHRHANKIYLHMYLSIYLFIYLLLYLSICLSTYCYPCMYISINACVHITLFIFWCIICIYIYSSIIIWQTHTHISLYTHTNIYYTVYKHVYNNYNMHDIYIYMWICIYIYILLLYQHIISCICCWVVSNVPRQGNPRSPSEPLRQSSQSSNLWPSVMASPATGFRAPLGVGSEAVPVRSLEVWMKFGCLGTWFWRFWEETCENISENHVKSHGMSLLNVVNMDCSGLLWDTNRSIMSNHGWNTFCCVGNMFAGLGLGCWSVPQWSSGVNFMHRRNNYSGRPDVSGRHGETPDYKTPKRVWVPKNNTPAKLTNISVESNNINMDLSPTTQFNDGHELQGLQVWPFPSFSQNGNTSPTLTSSPQPPSAKPAWNHSKAPWPYSKGCYSALHRSEVFWRRTSNKMLRGSPKWKILVIYVNLKINKHIILSYSFIICLGMFGPIFCFRYNF